VITPLTGRGQGAGVRGVDVVAALRDAGRRRLRKTSVRRCSEPGVRLPHRVNIDVFTYVGNCVRISERFRGELKS